MKILLQKVKKASVEVDTKVVSQIDRGLLLLVGFGKQDDNSSFDKAIDKLLSLRLWPDQDGKMFSASVREIDGSVLLVSQFTLLANCKKGLRPDFSQAMQSAEAEKLYNDFVNRFREKWSRVETGVFGGYMQVELVNDGPVTLLLDF